MFINNKVKEIIKLRLFADDTSLYKVVVFPNSTYFGPVKSLLEGSALVSYA